MHDGTDCGTCDWWYTRRARPPAQERSSPRLPGGGAEDQAEETSLLDVSLSASGPLLRRKGWGEKQIRTVGRLFFNTSIFRTQHIKILVK